MIYRNTGQSGAHHPQIGLRLATQWIWLNYNQQILSGDKLKPISPSLVYSFLFGYPPVNKAMVWPAWTGPLDSNDFPLHPMKSPWEIHGTDLCGEEGQALGQPTFVPMNLRRLVPTRRSEKRLVTDTVTKLILIYIYIYVHKLYTYMYMVNIWSIYVEYHENWILGFIGYAIQLSNK